MEARVGLILKNFQNEAHPIMKNHSILVISNPLDYIYIKGWKIVFLNFFILEFSPLESLEEAYLKK